jgi:uncharacterized protein (DUF169 family)
MTATRIRLPLPPVGVAIGVDDARAAGVPRYEGISYCDAIRRATAGERLIVRADSITTCRWSPVVLGLKTAADDFERALTPRLPAEARTLFAARLDRFPEGMSPDVVILRGPLASLRPLLAAVGEERTATEFIDRWRVAASALALLKEGGEVADTRFHRAARRVLGRLRPLPAWRKLTAFLFRSGLVTRGFDQVIKRTMADMSICRNSTVIPYLTGKANLSFFCTGGIAWGLNDPDLLTSGWPIDLYREIERLIDWKE